MRRRLAIAALGTLLVGVAPLAGSCGGGGKIPSSLVTEDPDSSTWKKDASAKDSPAPIDVDLPDTDPEDAGPKKGLVFAHSPTTLFRFEPYSQALTTIGVFDCTTNAVVDLAVDHDGAMYATTFTQFLSVDPTSAHCTVLHTGGPYPNSLSFVPAGTVDPVKEALVGYDIASYVRIDLTTGAMSTIGNLNPNVTGTDYQSSGDLISIIGDKTYLTAVLAGDAGSGGDYLVEVDPLNGKVLRLIGDTHTKFLFGLGYWGGTGYGFSQSGELVSIDMTNGASSHVLTLDGGTPFFGAGVTTLAPRVP